MQLLEYININHSTMRGRKYIHIAFVQNETIMTKGKKMKNLKTIRKMYKFESLSFSIRHTAQMIIESW